MSGNAPPPIRALDAVVLWLMIISAWLLAAATAVPAHGPSGETTETQPELTPYCVRISLTFARDPLLSREFRRDVAESTAELLERSYGLMWEYEIVEERLAWPPDRDGLARLSEDDMQRRFGQSGIDKVFTLTISTDGPRYALCCREWDAAIEQLGSIQSATTYQRRNIAQAAFELIGSSFQPLLTVDEVWQDSVRLRLRGGEFPAGDAELAQLREGDLVLPFFRYLNREGAVRRIQVVPWTYLRVRQVERGRVDCALISGLRYPLGTGRTRLVQIMGMRRRPRHQATQLRLVSQADPPVPLVAFQVRAVRKTFSTDEAIGEALQRVTDRGGTVRLPANSEQPLMWIYVSSGDALLARVPFVAGMAKSATFRLPDDSVRLRVEGEIEMLKGRLVDVVARRTALMARIRRLASGRDRQSVADRLTELDRLPDARDFQLQLTAIRVPALEQARRQGNRVAASRIEKLCNDASTLIERFLDADKVRALKEEIQELMAISEGNS